MKVFTTIGELRAELALSRGRSVGFVPTMGYLHEGHLTLARRARDENDLSVASIFVNPTQFGPTEDFATYPRDIDRDRAMLESVGTDVLFAPTVGEMYPAPPKTTVEVLPLGRMLEGALRPDYLRGAATVVAKLLNIVQPTRAYFGEKDYQQVLVVSQMVRDLSIPVEIVPVPTVRDADGLALSSRNVYLTPAERRAAPRLNLALAEARDAVRRGIATPAALEEHVRRFIAEEPLAEVVMVAVRDADTLEESGDALPERIALLLSVRFGKARLIDQAVIERDRA